MTGLGLATGSVSIFSIGITTTNVAIGMTAFLAGTSVASNTNVTINEDSSQNNARVLGHAGESEAPIIKNTSRIPSLTNTASYRVPDELSSSRKILSEVKNVASQSYTAQLKDYYLYAKQEGYDFNLYTRTSTKLSGTLQNLINAGEIKHFLLQ